LFAAVAGTGLFCAKGLADCAGGAAYLVPTGWVVAAGLCGGGPLAWYCRGTGRPVAAGRLVHGRLAIVRGRVLGTVAEASFPPVSDILLFGWLSR